MKFLDLHRAILDLGAVTVRPGFHLMHHSNAAKVWTWDEKRQRSYTLEHDGRRTALTLAEEQHEDGAKWRVILFGRQLRGRQAHAGNTARATFNSSNSTPEGYFLRPTLGPDHKAALRGILGNRRSCPKYVDDHIMLAKGDAATVLASFLQALSFIEDVKNQPVSSLAPIHSARPMFTIEDVNSIVFDEGAETNTNHKQRKRSRKLRAYAIEHYKAQSADGQLHCYVNDWIPDVPVRGDIVQIHHDEALADYPKEGRKLTFDEAIKFLFPLCPNCHRLLESKPGGGRYSIPELRALMQRRTNTK